MAMKLISLTALACGLAPALLPAAVHAQATPKSDNQKLEQRIDDLTRMMGVYKARIEKLETEVKARPRAAAKVAASKPRSLAAAKVAADKPPAAPEASPPQQPIVIADSSDGSAQIPKTEPPKADGEWDFGEWGKYVPGKGLVLTRGKEGELSFDFITYVRYLNELGLNPTYTDSFGRTTTLTRQQNVEITKVTLDFKGWLFTPDLTYKMLVWTQNPAAGDATSLAIGGMIGYRFADFLSLFGGVGSLPSTRSTNWTFPNWLKNDNRTLADEFFRASYSQGLWIEGKIVDGLEYRAMIADNLSGLGIDAAQLPLSFSTWSAAVWWMPTTGEFGPLKGFGDYETHSEFATMFGVHYTQSPEDKESQPGVNAFENSQIRLSDGTLLFSPDAFDTGGQVDKAFYRMADANAGFKYHGLSLEAEYYARWVSDLQVTGFIPVTHLFDQGYQVQASAMVLPKKLQVYAAGSQVLGQYGDPWDLTLGLNWYPFSRREVRVNMQGIYDYRSPTGALALPTVVGGTGWIFNTDFAVAF